MKNVTDEYKDMINAFDCDFAVTIDGDLRDQKDMYINLNLPVTDRLVNDIELLGKLNYGLYCGKLKIMEIN